MKGGGEPRKKNIATDSLPGCIGYYSFPLAPNDPCESCVQSDLCKRVKANFVPKSEVSVVLGKLEEIAFKVPYERSSRWEV